MTLWFVGAGVCGYGRMSPDARRAVSRSRAVYADVFTSPLGGSDLESLSGIAGGRVVRAERWMVEDGRQILQSASEGDAALVSYGDPYAATTHAELRTRAELAGIRTRTVPAPSAPWSALGECGLHHYKAGRTATVMEDARSAESTYYVVQRNMAAGSHTVLLLEYDAQRGFFLEPAAALRLLLAAEEGQRRGAVTPETFCVVASRVGSDDQAVTSGLAGRLRSMDFGAPPHLIIIPGSLHFTERDSLKALTRCLDEPASNSSETVARQMVSKYAPALEKSIAETARLCRQEGAGAALENARLYARDAEDFMGRGREETAVLCIGYAEGLLDGLRMASGLDPAGAGPRPPDPGSSAVDRSRPRPHQSTQDVLG